MRLSLGPILYFWDRDAVFDFYARVADAPVDIVYLGEVVCAKRRALRGEDWLRIAEELELAGKEVVFSTLALIEAESELGGMRRLCENGRFAVEANDMGAVNLLAGRARFVAGPHLNIYNAGTLALLAAAGARRWVMPVELGRDLLAPLQAARPAGMETEVFAFGRLPLAFSARCFTARAHNLGKDDCGFRCADYADGMLLSTQEDKPFLVLNGIQTQSAETCNLVGELDAMRALGVDVVRISPMGGVIGGTPGTRVRGPRAMDGASADSPQSRGTFEVVGAFRGALDGTLDAAAAGARLAAHAPYGSCNGYWYGRAGMDWVDVR